MVALALMESTTSPVPALRVLLTMTASLMKMSVSKAAVMLTGLACVRYVLNMLHCQCYCRIDLLTNLFYGSNFACIATGF